MNVYISVVVCTYNRAHILLGCLESLAAQTLDSKLFEVIVVDNGSMDNTKEVAETFVGKFSRFKIVSEPQQGHSFARNRGWREAMNPFVAYIDDDARACPDWLVEMVNSIERNPGVEAFGGPFDAFSEEGLPDWFPPECGSWSLGETERPIRDGVEFINGTNMIFSRKILETVGGFNVSLGGAKGKIFYGEDTRLIVDLLERGVCVYYVPSIKVHHMVANVKISLRWLLYSSYCHGRCSAGTFNLRRTWQGSLLGIVVGLMKMVLIFFRPGRIPIKRRVYYSLSGLCAEWGALVSYLFHREKPRG